ncbi:MAG: hypothetical protein JWP06_268 [Candidatus Saccharibacteria bacterium]|nr:hypothetical protein [Candidatus Saccharibacteria bacterium]
MIKTSSKQTGSTHVVIIIILVIALVATLGLVFWQNFINKKSADTSSNQKKPTTNQPAEKVKDPNEGYLVLKDWNIKFKLPTDTTAITYYKKQVEANNKDIEEDYEFSTKRVEALGGQCIEPNNMGSVIRLAVLSRTKVKLENLVSTSVVNNNEPIAGYYYYASGAQSICADEGTSIQQQDRNMIFNALLGPVAY